MTQLRGVPHNPAPPLGRPFFMNATPHLGPTRSTAPSVAWPTKSSKNNHGVEHLVLVGCSPADTLAKRLAAANPGIRGARDPRRQPRYRALPRRCHHATEPPMLRPSSLPNIDGATVVLVDDVLFTGEAFAPPWMRSSTSAAGARAPRRTG